MRQSPAIERGVPKMRPAQAHAPATASAVPT